MSKETHNPEQKHPDSNGHENKGHESKGHAKPEGKSAKGKHEPIAGACFFAGCKSKVARFNFCNEHFDHFKFGLIRKTGEPVSDYEKKFEHYLAYQKKQTARKVA